MAIEYLGLSSLNGPLAVLEGVSGAAYDEIVEMTVNGKEKKLGRIIEVYEDKAVIQVFESTENMALRNTSAELLLLPAAHQRRIQLLSAGLHEAEARPAAISAARSPKAGSLTARRLFHHVQCTAYTRDTSNLPKHHKLASNERYWQKNATFQSHHSVPELNWPHLIFF